MLNTVSKSIMLHPNDIEKISLGMISLFDFLQFLPTAQYNLLLYYLRIDQEAMIALTAECKRL